MSGCARSDSSEPDPRISGTWFLVSGSDHGQGLAVGAQVISLTITDAAHTGGAEPCSSYRATVTGGVGVVYVRPHSTSGTRDSCQTSALTQLQQHYFAALGASQFATISEGALVLTSPTSNLVFLRAAPEAIANLRNTNWVLYSVGTQVPSAVSGQKVDPVHLTFNGGGGMSLSSTCVSIDAEYTLGGEIFAVSHVVGSLLISTTCTQADRKLSSQTLALFDKPLLLNVAEDGKNIVRMLVITNLANNLNMVFRAAN